MLRGLYQRNSGIYITSLKVYLNGEENHKFPEISATSDSFMPQNISFHVICATSRSRIKLISHRFI